MYWVDIGRSSQRIRMELKGIERMRSKREKNFKIKCVNIVNFSKRVSKRRRKNSPLDIIPRNSEVTIAKTVLVKQWGRI